MNKFYMPGCLAERHREIPDSDSHIKDFTIFDIRVNGKKLFFSFSKRGNRVYLIFANLIFSLSLSLFPDYGD